MNEIRALIVELVTEQLVQLKVKADRSEVEKALGRPPTPDLGDYALGCFVWAKTLRRSPASIAADLAGRLSERLGEYPLLREIAAVGPYLNIRLDSAQVARLVVERCLSGGLIERQPGQGKTVVIDFSSPNVAKPFGIGHLRSTVIGAAIGRIYRELGYQVVGINHLGDWGTQFGKLMAAWLSWGDEETFREQPIAHLYELYVRFHREEEADPGLTQVARDWFKRLEDGDRQARDLWRRFREASLAEFERIYRRMGVRFEHVWGEAFYEDQIGPTVERIRKAGILEESEGAMVVRVEEYYPDTSPCLILRADGASLYTTRDIAAVLDRWERFHFDRMLYVTGADQADHFRKVFGVLKRLQLPFADRCEHVPFGRIHGISTRKGTLVFLEDVFDRARELSLELMRDREMTDPEREVEAERIGVGAVVFFDLSKERIKDSSFNWEAILQITGRTGPGLQYTQVRLKSLQARYLERFGELPAPEVVRWDLLREPELMGLVRDLGEYEQVVFRAAQSYEPAILSRYLLDLADGFNTFYSSGQRIVSEDAPLSAARVTLCRALLAVLLSGMRLLGVPAPDRM
ncbi:MAG: arginine--tRNA ligase [Bradymonadales bacterium]|nr:arginine--tRNA ligase [Bradymonadales bacterium]